jgi:diguanylate cyclase (GGDEF)-like protein/PAS domain S-box-containing protein
MALSGKNLKGRYPTGWADADAKSLPQWPAYCLAAAMALIALELRIAILPREAGFGFLTFYPTVAISALLFGAGPGLLCVALCALAADCVFIGPVNALGLSAGELLPMAVFCISGGIVCFLKSLRTSFDARKLRASRERLQAILDVNLHALLLIDAEGMITAANHHAETMLSYAPGGLTERPYIVIVPRSVLEEHPLLQACSTPDEGASALQTGPIQTKVMRRDGSELDVEMNISHIESAHGRLTVCAFHDNSLHNSAEEELRISAAAFESNDGIIVTDADGVIQRINLAFTKISGYTPEDLVGKTPVLLKSSRHDDAFYSAIWDSISETGGWRGEIWGRRKNGEEYPQWLNITAVKTPQGKVTHYVGVHSDITERKQAEAEIEDLAFFDQLTGLPNRTLFTDRLRQAIKAGGRNVEYGALLFIDLDDFKGLNDTLGHDVGDKLLRQVAKRLTSFVREVDTVARLGGDEFVVVLANLGSNEREAARIAEAIAEKVLASLRLPYHLDEFTYASTASIGATLFREKKDTFEDLMKQADLAMYKSKEVGRNTVRFFDPEMEAAIMQRAALEKDLRQGLSERHFLVYYQAQVNDAGRLVGAEALVRWQRPQRGIVMPIDFIQVAEETHLILQLGHWVMETVCKQLARWSSHPELSRLTLAVNVSAAQFGQADFVEQVQAVLAASGANPQRLKLELTESLLVDDVQTVIEKMITLKSKGVGFALDDFGTGYSSLAYLKRMPLDQLKIDQSFVRDVLIDQNDAAIAKTIVALAKSLGLSVIAEGVETEEQRAFLAQNGCHEFQGYLFSAPLPIAKFEELAANSETMLQK